MIRLSKIKENLKRPPTAAELRIQTDINEVKLRQDSTQIRFPNGDGDLMAIEVSICPDEAHYRKGEIVFSFEIPYKYPFKPPIVKCTTQILHPNIDSEGNVGLQILRSAGVDWRPVMSITTVIDGLYRLFLEPDLDDALNEEAATMLRDDPSAFEDRVRYTMPRVDLLGSFVVPKRVRT